LCHEIVGYEAHASHVASRTVHAVDQSELHRIGADGEYDRNGRGRGLGGQRRGGGAPGDNDGDALRNQIGCKCWQTVVPIVGPAIFDFDVPTFGEARGGEAFSETIHISVQAGRSARAQKPYRGHNRLLRTRAERHRNSTSKAKNAVAPSHDAPKFVTAHRTFSNCRTEGPDVRFGSLADMVVRIAISAVTPKADFGASAAMSA